MITVKVQCHCGQKYAFEVEPVNGRMPSPIACPVCHADGTMAANQIIAQSLAAQPPPPVPLAPRLAAAAPPPAVVAPAAPARPTAQEAIRRLSQSSGSGGGRGGRADNWKWWYYLLAGICIGGYSIWQSYTSGSVKPLGELFLAALCIAIGIWDFLRKRKAKQVQG